MISGQSQVGAYYIQDIIRTLELILEYRYIRICLFEHKSELNIHNRRTTGPNARPTVHERKVLNHVLFQQHSTIHWYLLPAFSNWNVADGNAEVGRNACTNNTLQPKFDDGRPHHASEARMLAALVVLL